VAREAKKIVSIDLPGGEFGGGYHPKRERLYKEFIADCPSTEMVLLRIDSQTESARDAAVQALENCPLDFLFIDGDHRYEGVRRDFELYEPLVAPGGLIAFHDIIAQLWHEVKGRYEHQEFIHDPNQGKMGIGVLIKDV
jgi:predicted O-methyltransferase YrrM